MDTVIADEGAGECGLSKHGQPGSAPSSALSRSPTPDKHRWRSPERIVVPLRDTFGAIVMDPCASSHPEFWFAEYNLTDWITGGRDVVVGTGEDGVCRAGRVADGLTESWRAAVAGMPGVIYANMPWGLGDVALWLAKCRREAFLDENRPIVACVQDTGAGWYHDVMTCVQSGSYAGPPSEVRLRGRPRFRLPDEERQTGCGRYPISLLCWNVSLPLRKRLAFGVQGFTS